MTSDTPWRTAWKIAPAGRYASRTCEACGEVRSVRLNEAGSPISEFCGTFVCPMFLRQSPPLRQEETT